MQNDEFNLLITLLKLKSYLISLLDEPEDSEGFKLTEEYLKRVAPERAEDILEILEKYNIHSDADIAFDESIHLRFQEIFNSENPKKKLDDLLNDYEIDANGSNDKDAELIRVKIERNDLIKRILKQLFDIAKLWSFMRDLIDKIDDYSELDDEEILRSDEEYSLDELHKSSHKVFEELTNLTNKYIKLLCEYYFTYGGNLSLDQFLRDLNINKELVDKRYKELFKDGGLDT